MFDLLIDQAKIIDGSGNPWIYGQVAVRGDRIAAITPPHTIPPDQAQTRIDAGGKVVCPGFIDIQSHAILPLMRDGRCLSKISQGVTTEIMGEAWTPAPFGGQIQNPLEQTLFVLDVAGWEARMRTWTRFRDWLEAMLEHGVSPNIGSFLGGGTLRMYAKGMAMGQPSAEERTIMYRVMREAMEDGAFGVSYALIYAPDAYADTDELVDICQVMQPYNGVYITHIRSESEGLIEGIEEAIEVGRRAGVPVEIYHLKASGEVNWHKMPQVIELIHQARAEDVDVTADMYPYTASGTGLTAVFPPWISAEGKLFENLRDPAVRRQIRQEVLHPAGDWDAVTVSRGPEIVMPIGFRKPENQQYVGKRLSEIAAMRGQDWVEATFDLLLSEEQRISTIYFTMSEENLRLQLQQPWIKIATDAGGFDPAWAKPLGPYHPRAYGTYPRVLSKYVREEKVISLEEAVRKMTSAVADRLSLRERGRLYRGAYADIVIFDPETIADRATFEDPHQLSIGVEQVWVNGVHVFRDGQHTGATPGRIVDGPGRD